MYQYTEFDRAFVRQRAAQYRDQLERNLSGQLSDDEFRPLRLQNGWYLQRHAPMLRVAIPYGELSSRQLRMLARIAREFDRDYAHFTTRQNLQFNWIALARSADVMELLASVDLHGIQTSGNCIRNITSDALAGIAADELADPRPFCEILRQWSTLHPEFAFLPRKFKIAVSGASEDRAATAWHDVGLQLRRNAEGELGFRVQAGGGMGRTPLIARTLREFLPWSQILNYLEALLRVYNRWGRRDNLYKARIKVLLKAEGQRVIDEIESEYRQIIEIDGAPHTLSSAELARVSACFVAPVLVQTAQGATETVANAGSDNAASEAPTPTLSADQANAFERWQQRNVAAHQNPALRAVTLSLKRLGQAPGDASGTQMERVAELADRFSAGELRVTHQQNLLLPWVRADQLPALWQAAHALGLASANIGLLSDMIACPGGDFCALANARSIPIAEAISERYQDLDELFDLGPIDLHISGCINSCGHHHSGHIGILGVDKDGREWYQVSIGGSDGAARSGVAMPGKVIGPAFASAEVADVIEAVLDAYCQQRTPGEAFIDAVKRLGPEPFRLAANAVRQETRAGAATLT